MQINEFIKQYHNHPILFIGSGFSLRYLKKSYNWENLLRKISFELKGTNEFFLDLKQECYKDDKYNYDKLASRLEQEFDKILKSDRNGKFKNINDIFYKLSDNDILTSRMKIYIAELLKKIDYKDDIDDEIKALKKVRKNIGSIITTNYDLLIEDIFQFNPLIGNDILLSNPYGSVYKIHGCVNSPENIIITEKDYLKFDQKYELIRAQLLSLFIHNPIIFIGYSLNDENIRKILRTIFSYIDKDSDIAEKISKNFLLVEFEKNSTNLMVHEHDIVLDSNTTITVNKIKTDNYLAIYESLSNLHLSISAMDIRKVQAVVKEIYTGGNIKVNIVDDIDNLENNEKVVAIGNINRITYEYHTVPEIIQKYFEIIDEENKQILDLINKHNIQSSQYFPVFGFSKINENILDIVRLKSNQIDKISAIRNKFKELDLNKCISIKCINDDESIAKSNKFGYIAHGLLNKKIDLEECKEYLINYNDKKATNYKKILCIYDYIKYSDEFD